MALPSRHSQLFSEDAGTLIVWVSVRVLEAGRVEQCTSEMKLEDVKAHHTLG
jgi:hypothetical protein